MTTQRRATLVVLAVVTVLTATPTAATAGMVSAPPSDDAVSHHQVIASNAEPDRGHVSVLATGDTEFADVVASAAGNPLRGAVTLGNSRFRDAGPLENETRESLYETISENPGIYVAELARRTDTHVSTVRYHVRKLVDEGLIERHSERGRSHLSPAGSGSDGSVAPVEDGTRRVILVSLARQGAATGEELSERLDRSKSTLSYHLQRLADDGLIEREEAGREVVNVLATTVDGTHATAQD